MNIAQNISLVIAPALIMGSFNTLAPTDPTNSGTTPTATTPSMITAQSAQIITETGRIVDFYSDLGIAQVDIPIASPTDSPTLETVIDLVSSPTASTPPLSTSLPTDCSNTGDLIAYSQQKAVMNNARDRMAGTIESETVHMYMSHFFDLPSMCANPTAYYPDWITSSDRTAYNSYFTASNSGALAASVGQMILSATNLVDSPVAAVNKLATHGFGGRLAGGTVLANKGLAADTLIHELVSMNSALASGSTPQQLVDQMRTNLSATWSDADTANAVIGTAAALMMPSIAGIVFGLGATAISIQITGLDTLYQTAAYNALRYTISSRASARFMRSLGW